MHPKYFKKLYLIFLDMELNRNKLEVNKWKIEINKLIEYKYKNNVTEPDRRGLYRRAPYSYIYLAYSLR